jgi:WD40 repeat protein
MAMPLRRFLACLVISISTACMSGSAQQPCPVLTVPQIVPGSNIFTPQQEVQLGEIIASSIQQTNAVVKDEALTGHAQAVVDRLAQGLPPDRPPFKVMVVELPTANAFSVVGGRIYIGRKLIAIIASEDELAGILAHEMGHIVAHHQAIEMSEAFRRVLGVTQVTSREDISAKWNQYLSNRRKQHVSAGDWEKHIKLEDREQAQADSIALYLVSRAGYSTNAFVEIFDRLAGTQGKTGGFWSDLFGQTLPDQKRLREMVNGKPPMPASCVASRIDVASGFSTWKNDVIEYSDSHAKESLPGLISKQVLSERLRPDLHEIRISPDGKYVLAQDESNIFVLTRRPLQTLFRIDAPDAGPAQFTPDSRGIVFQIAGLEVSPRVEHWDIDQQKRLEVHEVFIREGCLSSVLSPDGKTLACLTHQKSDVGLDLALDLYDTSNGASLWHKKDWVVVNRSYFDFSTLLRIYVGIQSGSGKVFEQLSRVAFSPSGHWAVACSPENVMAMDLISHATLPLSRGIKDLLDHRRFTFLADDRFLGVAGQRGDKSAVVEFPSGRVIYKDLFIGGSDVFPVAHGDYVQMRPIKDNPLGVMDLKQGKIVMAGKRKTIDIWDNEYIAERADGNLQLYDMATTKHLEDTKLPQAPLGTLKAAVASPDLRWLAVSETSRGALWDLQTGKRLQHVRGFSAGYFGADATLYLDFPKFEETERTVAKVPLNGNEISSGEPIEEKTRAIMAGPYLLTTIGNEKSGFDRNVTLELRDNLTGKVLWTKTFPDESPKLFIQSKANRLVFFWYGRSKTVQSMVNQDPALAARVASVKERDGVYLARVYDLDTGMLHASIVLDTGKNSFRITHLQVANEYLVVSDDQNRVLMYSAKGEVKGAIAGRHPEISTSSQFMAVRTERRQLSLYDLATLDARAEYDFSSPVAFSAFSADGKRLLVLTADQTVYLFDVSATIRDTNSVAAK